MPKYSQSPRKKLHKKAWGIFSKYIRFIRDKGICYTCGVIKDPKSMDAGHYKHSDTLDFDELNIHCQCVNCNRDLHGNPRSYRLKLVQEHGQNAVADIERRAKELNMQTEDDYIAIINKYSELIK